MSHVVDIPPRGGASCFAGDAELRLGLHIRHGGAALTMMAAKTGLRNSASRWQYAAMLSLYYVPGNGPRPRRPGAAAVTTQTMATVIMVAEQKRLVTRHPSSDRARSPHRLTTDARGETLLLRCR